MFFSTTAEAVKNATEKEAAKLLLLLVKSLVCETGLFFV